MAHPDTLGMSIAWEDFLDNVYIGKDHRDPLEVSIQTTSRWFFHWRWYYSVSRSIQWSIKSLLKASKYLLCVRFVLFLWKWLMKYIIKSSYVLFLLLLIKRVKSTISFNLKKSLYHLKSKLILSFFIWKFLTFHCSICFHPFSFPVILLV